MDSTFVCLNSLICLKSPHEHPTITSPKYHSNDHPSHLSPQKRWWIYTTARTKRQTHRTPSPWRACTPISLCIRDRLQVGLVRTTRRKSPPSFQLSFLRSFFAFLSPSTSPRPVFHLYQTKRICCFHLVYWTILNDLLSLFNVGCICIIRGIWSQRANLDWWKVGIGDPPGFNISSSCSWFEWMILTFQLDSLKMFWSPFWTREQSSVTRADSSEQQAKEHLHSFLVLMICRPQ